MIDRDCGNIDGISVAGQKVWAMRGPERRIKTSVRSTASHDDDDERRKENGSWGTSEWGRFEVIKKSGKEQESPNGRGMGEEEEEILNPHICGCHNK